MEVLHRAVGFLQCGGEVIGHGQGWAGSSGARNFDAIVVELDGFFDQANDGGIGWQLIVAGDFGGDGVAAGCAPVHCGIGGCVLGIIKQGSFPEADSAVLFEGGHGAHGAFVFKGGDAPFDGLSDVGAGFVHEFAKAVEDWLSKWCSVGDVLVDARVDRGHWLIVMRARLERQA